MLFPGAFVELHSDGYNALPSRHKLRVTAGGIWHNIVLCIACALMIASLPALQWPLYINNIAAPSFVPYGGGVVVAAIGDTIANDIAPVLHVPI